MNQIKLFLASGNVGKQNEFSELCAPFHIALCFPQDLPVYQEPAETAHSFVENALIKARYGAKISGLPCLADDSGLCVHGLQGAPGVYSAHYSGQANSELNKQTLRQDIQHFSEQDRQAFFACVLVLVRDEHDPMPLVFQGLWQGMVLPEEQGEEGFGYDPMFYVPAYQKTAAQLSCAQKNAVSHRAQALRKLLAFLQEHPAYI